MKRIPSVLECANLILLFLLSATFMMTASGCSLAYPGRVNEEIHEFRAFLRDHPRASAQLQRNPNLAYNSSFHDEHEELKDFLKESSAGASRDRSKSGARFWELRPDDRSDGYFFLVFSGESLGTQKLSPRRTLY
jgi:hypothetical protein